MSSDFYKEKENSKIWLVDDDEIGTFLFSFDKKEIYNFWSDYDKLSMEQKKIFSEKYPAMAKLKE